MLGCPVQRVIHDQRDKEVRKFHSQASAEELLQGWAAQFASDMDSGHLTHQRASPFANSAADAVGGGGDVPLGEAPGNSLGNERMSSPVGNMPTVTEVHSEAQSRSGSGRTTSGSLGLDRHPSAQVWSCVVACHA